jgi:hypothetical protein
VKAPFEFRNVEGADARMPDVKLPQVKTVAQFCTRTAMPRIGRVEPKRKLCNFVRKVRGRFSSIILLMKLTPIERCLSITYSSGLRLSGPDLATLATYYDEVWLPYPFNWDPNASVIFHPVGNQPSFQEALALYQNDYLSWRSQNALLFEEGILKTLPPPWGEEGPPPKVWEELESMMGKRESGHISSAKVATGLAALAVHILAAKKDNPQIFLHGSELRETGYTTWDNWLVEIFRRGTGGSARWDGWLKSYVDTFWLSTAGRSPEVRSREELSTYLIRALFQIVAPSLPSLGAEKILETRKKLRPFRQGFTEYIISMTDEIEKAVASGKTLEDAAHAISDRKIIPAAQEFIRKNEKDLLSATRAVVGESGGFFKLLTVESTPEFWATLLGTLFKVVGDFLQGVAVPAREMAQNSSQAFAYIGTLAPNKTD